MGKVADSTTEMLMRHAKQVCLVNLLEGALSVNGRISRSVKVFSVGCVCLLLTLEGM